MRHPVLWNTVMNGIIAVALILLSAWAFTQGVEESFISTALLCGVILIVGNALFVATLSRRGIR